MNDKTALVLGRFLPFHLVSLLSVLEEYARGFYEVGESIGRIKTALSVANDNEVLDAPTVDNIKKQLEAATGWCESVGLKMSVLGIKRILEQKDRKWFTGLNLRAAFGEMERRINDEFESVVFFHVPSERERYYSEGDLFGEAVAGSFLSASYDIEEAGKCYALGRGTACVMHLMRVVEIGLKELGRSLQIPDTVPSWDGILGKIDTELQKRYSQGGWNQEDSDFYSDAARHLRTYIKTRNRTQHADKKYTIEEAKRIFDAVHELMDHLSTRLEDRMLIDFDKDE